ncbi:collagen alpha-1(X) chain [Sus scrofa]|uniref:collagen alpha-1(X) chain n=1 Tax=Sus scrofa TaxID=9823 RepID=UPI0006B1A75A|nr:collagen alpha-1(X) chain [Sus scrofa]
MSLPGLSLSRSHHGAPRRPSSASARIPPTQRGPQRLSEVQGTVGSPGRPRQRPPPNPASAWPKPQGQPAMTRTVGTAGWGVWGRAGAGLGPQNPLGPAGGGQGPEEPLLTPTTRQSSGSWTGWTGFCVWPGWGELSVGAHLSPHVVRPVTGLPPPRDGSCRAASHQGSGEARHQDLSVLRGQLGLLPRQRQGAQCSLFSPASRPHPSTEAMPVPSSPVPHTSPAGPLSCSAGWELGLARRLLCPPLEAQTSEAGQREQRAAGVQGLDVLREARKMPQLRQSSASGRAGLGAGTGVPRLGSLQRGSHPPLCHPPGPLAGGLLGSVCSATRSILLLSDPQTDLPPRLDLSPREGRQLKLRPGRPSCLASGRPERAVRFTLSRGSGFPIPECPTEAAGLWCPLAGTPPKGAAQRSRTVETVLTLLYCLGLGP